MPDPVPSLGNEMSESERISEREREWIEAGSPYYRCPVCQAGDVDPFTCEGGVVPGDPPHRLRRAIREPV